MIGAMSAASVERRGRGRPRKGVNRGAAYVRAPQDHVAVYKREAQERGMPLSDYLARVLAAAHDLDEPDYLQDKGTHPTIPGVQAG